VAKHCLSKVQHKRRWTSCWLRSSGEIWFDWMSMWGGGWTVSDRPSWSPPHCQTRQGSHTHCFLEMIGQRWLSQVYCTCVLFRCLSIGPRTMTPSGLTMQVLLQVLAQCATYAPQAVRVRMSQERLMEPSQQTGGSSTPAWGWGRFADSRSLESGIGWLTLKDSSAESAHNYSLCGGIIWDIWTSS